MRPKVDTSDGKPNFRPHMSPYSDLDDFSVAIVVGCIVWPEAEQRDSLSVPDKRVGYPPNDDKNGKSKAPKLGSDHPILFVYASFFVSECILTKV